MAATTTLLGLVTPTQGTLSGTWGDTVNYGITDYVDIAIAGTLSFTGDGAVTLANTTGSASGNAITTTTAQYMVIRITGTQTVTKVITAPSYSKLYMVDHAGATSAVTFKAAGQTGVSIAVGEKAFVYYNGTDYVKVSSSIADGVTTIDFGSTGLTPNTATSGAVTVAGTLAVANGGTGLTAGTSGGVPYYSASGVIASSAALAAASLVVGGGAGAAPATTTTGTGVVTALGTNVGSAGAFVVNGGALGTPSSGTLSNATDLPISTGVSGLGANVATFLATPTSANLISAVSDETGSGSLVFATSPTLVTPLLGTPTSGTLSNCTVDGTDSVGFRNIPQNAQTGSYTMVLADSGKHIYHASGAGAATYTIPAASSVAYPIGTAITFINLSATSISIAITTDTMYLSSAGTTGTRTLAQYGSATAIKVSGVSSSGIWVISGSALT